MVFTHLIFEKKDRIVRTTINRPEVLDALDVETIDSQNFY